MLTWSLGAAAAATSRWLRTRREGREETLDGEVASRGLGSSLGAAFYRVFGCGVNGLGGSNPNFGDGANPSIV